MRDTVTMEEDRRNRGIKRVRKNTGRENDKESSRYRPLARGRDRRTGWE